MYGGPNNTFYGEQLDNVKTFKYIGAMVIENGTSNSDFK